MRVKARACPITIIIKYAASWQYSTIFICVNLSATHTLAINLPCNGYAWYNDSKSQHGKEV